MEAKNNAVKIMPRLFLYILLFSSGKNGYAQKHERFINSTAVIINGSPVTTPEFVCRMQWLKASCLDHFLKKYGATGAEQGFWTHSFGGLTPAQWIREKCLQQLIKEKVTLHFMQLHNVLTGFDYNTFLNAFRMENKQRSKTAANSGTIYGLLAFNELSFYEYIFSNARLQTQKRILAVSPPADVVIKKMYEAVKEKEFKIPNTITVSKITFAAAKKTDLNTLKLKSLVKKAIPAGIDELINDGRNNATLSCTAITFEPGLTKANEMMWGNVMEQALKLKKDNVISPLFTDEEGDDCFLLLKKTASNGYQPFSEVKENIRMRWAGERLEKNVQHDMRQAIVHINHRVLDKLDM